MREEDVVLNGPSAGKEERNDVGLPKEVEGGSGLEKEVTTDSPAECVCRLCARQQPASEEKAPSKTNPQQEISTATTAKRHRNFRDAETYTGSIKEQFSDIFDVYSKLLGLIIEFRSQRIDTNGFLQRLSTLSAECPHLIEGFNKYLPAGYLIECTKGADNSSEITITTPEGSTIKTQTIESPLHPVAGPSIVNSIIEENLNRYLHERYSAVVECMSRVKQRFAGHEELNREFTDILKSYPPIDYEQFAKRINVLFRDSPDLLSELRKYFSQEMLDALNSVVADSPRS